MARTLFPKISVYQQEWLRVDEGHQLYIEQSGNPKGVPVVYLHGGPGGGSSPNQRRYFDPEKYRIILFDQRGCGRSKPSPSVKANNVDELVSDIEKIREHLAIEKWLVCGGSWGTALAMLYGIKYPEKVLAFVLRGVFLGTQSEIDWLYQEKGAQGFFPEYYREFIEAIPERFRSDPVKGYAEVLSGKNELAVIAASKAWYLWELRLSTVEHHNISMAQVEDAHQALCMAKVSSHYFSQQCLIEENFILKNIETVAHIPAILMHGRFDMVCQLQVADKLARAWQNAHLQILPFAGHSGFEQQTIDAFCKATDTMANFLAENSSSE